MYALTNNVMYTGDKILQNHALVVVNDKIYDICPINKLPQQIFCYDLSGDILSPGFIDLQVNGCGGVQFNEYIYNISLKTLNIMQNTNQKFGCTSFLPTLISSDDVLIKQAIKIMRIFLSQNKNQALGLHLEGPYINLKKKGIHNSFFIRTPTKEMVSYLCDNNDVIKKITLAPELIKQSVINRLCASGINISIGHSNATYKQSQTAFNSGITLATHLFNAMPPLTAREPGIIGFVFDTPQIYCSIIADGLHVNWANIRSTKLIKNDRLILVTDSTLPAGIKDIKKFIFAGKIIHCKKNLYTDNHGVLSGSSLTMIKAIKNIVKYAKIPLDEAIRMATLYPAKYLGIDNVLGSLSINKIANLTVFNKEYKVTKTIINGKHIYISKY